MLIRLTCILFLAAAVSAQSQFRERSTGADAAVWDAAFVDIDGDGDQDLLQSASGLVTLKRNDGSGHFTDEAIVIQAGGWPTLQVGDFDGDGDDDALVLAPSVQGSVLLRNGLGPVGVEVLTLPAIAGTVFASAVADFDVDGDLDIVLAPNQSAPLMLRNDGAGAFVLDPAGFAGILLTFVSSLSVGEFNGDGVPDLYVMQLFGPSILLNDGSGAFQVSTGPIPQLSVPQSVAVADFDGDAISDVFVSVQSTVNPGTVILRGDGQGGLTTLGSLSGGGLYRLAAADLDEDGDIDVAGTGGSSSTTTLSIYLNDGQGGFTDATATRANVVPERLARIAAGDADGDGDVDLFLGGFPLPVPFPQLLFINHHRQVAVTNQPAVGGALALELNHRPGYGTGLGIGLSVAGVAAPYPMPSPFGPVWIDPAMVVNLPFVSFAGTNGTAQLIVPIPNQPHLAGVELLVQALPLDVFPASGSYRLTGFDRVVIAP